MRPILRAGGLALGAAFVVAGIVSAQVGVVRGRVVDAEGRPRSGETVVLHRVAESGGAEVARATSDAEGRFELATDGGPGVYFAATRVEGALFFGAPFRDPAEVGADYRIVVDGGGGGAAGPARPGPTESFPWLVALLVGSLGLVAVAWPIVAARREPYATRALLAELAGLDEEHAAAADGDADAYRARRSALLARLRERSGTAPSHAADQR